MDSKHRAYYFFDIPKYTTKSYDEDYIDSDDEYGYDD
jgi:hypothetical protein